MIAFFEKIRDYYWSIIPYDRRPWQIWYKIKCWAWKRYTTVKPRYLPHTWVDRVDVLPHTMFEILSLFIEKECSPEIVDWEATGHMIKVNDRIVNVRDEMQDLYDWWHRFYNKQKEEIEDKIWEEADQHRPERFFRESEDGFGSIFDPVYKSEEDKEIYDKCIAALSNLEENAKKELMERMHRLVNLMPYLWT